MKRIVIFVAALFAAGIISAQQHITNFGVVDTARIYEEYFGTSSSMSSYGGYSTQREEIQREIDSRAAVIRDLQARAKQAESYGNNYEAESYREQIRLLAAKLKEYKEEKEAELRGMRGNSGSSGDFSAQLNRIIKKVAENEGLSMVINLQQNDSILWYSPAVDITDKVIKALPKR